MLAFAKDIIQKELNHPEEGNNPKLKEYMDYQRKIHHEKSAESSQYCSPGHLTGNGIPCAYAVPLAPPPRNRFFNF